MVDNMFEITQSSDEICTFCGRPATTTVGASDVNSIHICQNCMIRMRDAFVMNELQSWLFARTCDPYHVGLQSILKNRYPAELVDALFMSTGKFTEMITQSEG